MVRPSPALHPIKMVEVELSQPLQTIVKLDGYMAVKVLVRLHGSPLGYVQLGITNGQCTAETLSRVIIEQHSWTIVRHLLNDGFSVPPPPSGLSIEDLIGLKHPQYNGPFPLVTAVICTRDRAADLALSLEALSQVKYPNLDILVVDNAPSDDATNILVSTRYPHVRYVCEPRPGLSWARNRAIAEACGEIIAFTDDDVVVDAYWIQALAQVFAENPEVMAVTGLVVPHELETEAQVLFEWHGGFGRGFERKWYHVNKADPTTVAHHGAGIFGTGANMAFRRSLFEHVGCFDTALGVGTATCGGEDLEMFFRVLHKGYTLAYDPEALVFHRHRRDYDSLRRQLANNGCGLSAYHTRSMLAYPDQRPQFIKLHLWWLVYWHIRRLMISLTRPYHFPRNLILAELRGYLVGMGRYFKARRKAMEIARQMVDGGATGSRPAILQYGNGEGNQHTI